MKPKEPPECCQEIPGFICVVVEGCAWLTKEGDVTTDWNRRGVWDTTEEAKEVALMSLRPLMTDSSCDTQQTLRDNLGVTG